MTLEGKLARIGPNDLVTCDPNLLRQMLAVRTPYKRADYYDGFRFDPSRDNILSQRDDVKHGIIRAKMAAGVGVSSLSVALTDKTSMQGKITI